jgi:hypothetical protein
MSQELTVLNNTGLAVADNQFEVDFSQVKKIKPMTLNIDQPTSTHDDNKPGFIRTTETGDLREKVKVVLIAPPRETRKMQSGVYPNQETVCFSSDMKVPHNNSPQKQALLCSGCKQSSWERYNKTKDDKDKPKCEITSNVSLIDYDYCIPVKMHIRGLSRTNKGDGGGFENGVQQILQRFVALKMSRGSASWTDVMFTLSTRKVKGKPAFALCVSDVHPVTEEERQHLSGILSLVSQQRAAILAKDADETDASTQAQVEEQTTQDIAEAVSVGPAQTSNPLDGEYVKGTVEEI